MQQNFMPSAATNHPASVRWNTPAQINSYTDQFHPTNIYPAETMSQPPYQQPISAPSTQLARRPGNRQLISTGQHQPYDGTTESWSPYGDNVPLEVQAPNGVMEENENIELLEDRAVVAKREAQSKRKQIPPFIQKLSRYESICVVVYRVHANILLDCLVSLTNQRIQSSLDGQIGVIHSWSSMKTNLQRP